MALLNDVQPRRMSATTRSDDLADVTRAVERLADRLAVEFSESLRPVIVRDAVARVAADFSGATVVHFIPLLVERRARQDLACLLQAQPSRV